MRLLELENKRAVKKISEAEKRATNMAELKQKNDQKYMEVRKRRKIISVFSA